MKYIKNFRLFESADISKELDILYKNIEAMFKETGIEMSKSGGKIILTKGDKKAILTDEKSNTNQLYFLEKKVKKGKDWVKVGDAERESHLLEPSEDILMKLNLFFVGEAPSLSSGISNNTGGQR